MFTSVLQVVHSFGGLSLTAKCLNALQGLGLPELMHLKKKNLVPEVPIIQHSQVFCQGLSVCLKKGPSFSNWDCPPTRYSYISHSLALTSTFSHTSQTSSSTRWSRTYRYATISQVDLILFTGPTDVQIHSRGQLWKITESDATVALTIVFSTSKFAAKFLCALQGKMSVFILPCFFNHTLSDLVCTGI